EPGAAAAAGRAAGGRVTRDGAAGDGERTRTERGIALVVEAAAEAVAAVAVRAAGTTDCGVATESAAAHGDGRAQEICDTTTQAAPQLSGGLVKGAAGAPGGRFFLVRAFARGARRSDRSAQRTANAIAWQVAARIAGAADCFVVAE